jgi:hypothetical protein
MSASLRKNANCPYKANAVFEWIRTEKRRCDALTITEDKPTFQY